MLDKRVNPKQVGFHHGAEGIHNGKSIGLDPIHLCQKLQNHLIGISHDIDGIAKHLISLVFGLTDKCQTLVDIIIMKRHADRVDGSAVVILQLVYVVLIMQRHGGKQGVAPLLR